MRRIREKSAFSFTFPRNPRLPLLLAVLALLGGGFATAGAAPEEGSAEVPAAELERARAAGKALAGDLMGRLLEELGRGGPAAALKVCSEVAQDVAAAHSKDGLTVRRVSAKVRNPADRPDAWEQAQLTRLEGLHGSGELPAEVAVVTDEGGRSLLRWLKPIVMAEPCLRCHGDPESFDPAVRQTLEELYPEDEAVGYRAGDLRGAVSVTVELSEGAEPAAAPSSE